ncbi:MAG: hypothetical protein HYS18_15015 [Burkholderiales bacterium]|nr:hypothetical protein [Burkholderiales bacterium]
MSHLNILLPFALPPAELARDLLRDCKTPALAMLLARAQSVADESFDAFSRSLPHETWLAQQFGLSENAAHNSPPIAKAAMRSRQLAADEGSWFVLHPVHLHIARDHLVLTDIRQLALSEKESHNLFDAALPLFKEAGKTLVYGDALTWFMRADDWQNLHTSTPDAATGHNIDIWMPEGESARAWRKLQNEVQMHWHIHPVNQLREGCGDKPVNSIWLWGGASVDSAQPVYRFDRTFRLHGWPDALAHLSDANRDFSATEVIQQAPEHGLLMLDSLLIPALGSDWGTWLQYLHRLESEWFTPLLSALQARRIDRISLILTHNTRLSEYTITSRSLYKFWVKPSLNRLS